MNRNGRIGYACTPVSIPFRTSRGFILKNFNKENFEKCARENLKDLKSILEWNTAKGIYMFRISSDIIPFGSHPVNSIEWWEIFDKELKSCGDYIKKHGIRVSMHPGQYTVLNSPKKEVAEKSIKDLNYHSKFLDALGVDESNKLILHVGGVYGDKNSALKRFMEHFFILPQSVKNRLTIENDDRSFTIEDVLKLCNTLKIPAVFDNLHHKLNPSSIEWEEILDLVRDTWTFNDGPVKLHYSDQDIDKKGGAHSKTVDISSFLNYMESIKDLNADVMLEVKDKEVSAIKCINALQNSI